MVFVGSVRYRRLRTTDLEASHAPRVCVEHFEFDSGRMSDDFPTYWNPASECENNTTDRVDIVVFVERQLQVEMFFKLRNWSARSRYNAKLGIDRDVGCFVFIVLVFDLANDLFYEVFDCNQPVRTTIFIDDESHMLTCRLHPEKQVHGRH